MQLHRRASLTSAHKKAPFRSESLDQKDAFVLVAALSEAKTTLSSLPAIHGAYLYNEARDFVKPRNQCSPPFTIAMLDWLLSPGDR